MARLLHNRGFLLLLLFLLQPTLLLAETSEIEIARGVIALNANRVMEAEKYFQEALRQDPESFIALEYLSNCVERRLDLKQAREYLRRAKGLSPEKRKPVLEFHLGRLSMLLGDSEGAFHSLKIALANHVFPQHTNYLLGLFYFKKGLFLDAQPYLLEAVEVGSREGGDVELLQASNYYLGEAYARLRYPRYAAASLRQAERGLSPELRAFAWKVHSALSHPASFARIGILGQYDSRPVITPLHTQAPIAISDGRDTARAQVEAQAGWNSGMVRPLSVGIDAGIEYNQVITPHLREFDTLVSRAQAALSLWNRRSLSFDLGYGVSHMRVNSANLVPFQTLHGPTMKFGFFPGRAWNLDIGGQYSFDHFSLDSQISDFKQSGAVYGGFAEISLRAPGQDASPKLKYSYQRDKALGDFFQSKTHLLELVLALSLSERLEMIPEGAIAWIDFPTNLLDRVDTVYRYGLGFSYAATKDLSFFFKGLIMDSKSTVAQFAYNRTLGTTGLRYQF